MILVESRRFVYGTVSSTARLKRYQQLRHIGSLVTTLNQHCLDVRQHIDSARQESLPVLQDASQLLGQKQESETKKQLLDAFDTHFLLTSSDMMVLTNPSEPIDDRFFALLTRLNSIHADCQILLGAENQRLGLELMDRYSKDLSSAYQKLFKWVQKEFKTLDLENPQISSSISRALRVLAERPSLFHSCLESFAEARQRVLTDAFYAALTGSGGDHHQEPLTKPIEYFAHDPLRYVGDMLAWTHSITVGEREALEGLFVNEQNGLAKGIRAGLKNEPWSGAQESIFDGRKALCELVDRDLTEVVKTVRQRVEQVVQTHDDSVLIYKIANLINFYRLTFTSLLGTESTVLSSLSDLEQSTLRQFRSIMQDHARSISVDFSEPSPNLEIPDFLEEALSRLKELTKSYDSSLAPPSSKEAGFQPVLTEAIDPYIEGCQNLAKTLEQPVSSIFLLNCLLATKSVLLTYNFTNERVSRLAEDMDVCTSGLIDYQHAFFLHTSGLHPLIVALAALSDSEEDVTKIPTLGAFQHQALADASHVLDDFLPSAFLDAMENLKKLSSPKMAKEITEEAADRFCEDYEFLEAKLTAADELLGVDGASDDSLDKGDQRLLRASFPRTSAEVRVLLS